MQAPPAEVSLVPRTREAEPPRQCVPRQEPGNEPLRGGVQREVSVFRLNEPLWRSPRVLRESENLPSATYTRSKPIPHKWQSSLEIVPSFLSQLNFRVVAEVTSPLGVVHSLGLVTSSTTMKTNTWL